MQTTKVHSRETGYPSNPTSIKEFGCLFKVVKNIFIKKISGPGGFNMNTTWTLLENWRGKNTSQFILWDQVTVKLIRKL